MRFVICPHPLSDTTDPDTEGKVNINTGADHSRDAGSLPPCAPSPFLLTLLFGLCLLFVLSLPILRSPSNPFLHHVRPAPRQRGDLSEGPRGPQHAFLFLSMSKDTVGSLLADIANFITDSLRILDGSDKSQWGPDEHEQLRRLEHALDEARKDFQELSPFLDGQRYYMNDRRREFIIDYTLALPYHLSFALSFRCFHRRTPKPTRRIVHLLFSHAPS